MPAVNVVRFHLKARALFLAKKLWDSFAAGDDGQRIAITGDIIPHGTLRSRSLRQCLKWAERSSCKFVTSVVASQAIEVLIKKYQLQYPIIPGISVRSWKRRQAERIVQVCYRVKKNSQARQVSLAMTDFEETQVDQAGGTEASI